MAGYKSFIQNPKKQVVGKTIRLDPKESHHLIKVLRAQEGSNVTVLNESGKTWKTTIKIANSKKAILQIESYIERPRPNRPKIILVQALVKGKTMDSIIQHTTEIGVDRIIPITSDQSEVTLDKARQLSKHEKWTTVIKEACKQSGNPFLPFIDTIRSFENWTQHIPANSLVLVASLQDGSTSLKEALDAMKTDEIEKIFFIIGPEGDFSDNEYKQLKAIDCKPISLGNNVLRAETAAICAIHQIISAF